MADRGALMAHGDITAEVVTYTGRCGDPQFDALLLRIEGVNDPHMLTMSFPRSTCVGLADKVDTSQLYRLIERAINDARLSVAA